MMFPSTFLLGFLSLWIHHWVTVSEAVDNEQCPDKPVFTPPSLVVRYNHSTSATCNVCQSACLGQVFGLEKPVGTKTQNGTEILWEVARLTEWDTGLICYYNSRDGKRCRSRLTITVYEPPAAVAISFDHGDGPLLEGRSYTLRCNVQQVAPVERLIVTFYKGRDAMQPACTFSDKEKMPVDELCSIDINATEEDDGAVYWCDARLDLEAQPLPPLVTSGKLKTTVHYKPRLVSPSSPGVITVTEGYPFELNCSAVGNPAPSYDWKSTARGATPASTSVYSVESVTFDHRGQYNCTATNSRGAVTLSVRVEVEGDYTGYLIGGLVIGFFFLILVAVALYRIHYKRYRTGRYDLKKVICCGQHSPVPTSE